MSLSNFCKVSERVLLQHVIILQPTGKKQLIEEPTLAGHNAWPALHDTEGHRNVTGPSSFSKGFTLIVIWSLRDDFKIIMFNGKF